MQFKLQCKEFMNGCGNPIKKEVYEADEIFIEFIGHSCNPENLCDNCLFIKEERLARAKDELEFLKKYLDHEMGEDCVCSSCINMKLRIKDLEDGIKILEGEK